MKFVKCLSTFVTSCLLAFVVLCAVSAIATQTGRTFENLLLMGGGVFAFVFCLLEKLFAKKLNLTAKGVFLFGLAIPFVLSTVFCILPEATLKTLFGDPWTVVLFFAFAIMFLVGLFVKGKLALLCHLSDKTNRSATVLKCLVLGLGSLFFGYMSYQLSYSVLSLIGEPLVFYPLLFMGCVLFVVVCELTEETLKTRLNLTKWQHFLAVYVVPLVACVVIILVNRGWTIINHLETMIGLCFLIVYFVVALVYRFLNMSIKKPSR